MKYIKKLIMIVGLVALGGIIIVGLSGCNRKNSREWIENKFAKEVSQVYPTKNLTDLFKAYPDGFEITQTYFEDDYVYDIILRGNKETKEISGEITKTASNQEIIDTISISYEENGYVFSDTEKAKKYWPFQGFLFQKKSINQEYLASLQMTGKTYDDIATGRISIKYDIEDKEINSFLGVENNAELSLLFEGNRSTTDYRIVIEDGKGFYFLESIK